MLLRTTAELVIGLEPLPQTMQLIRTGEPPTTASLKCVEIVEPHD